MYVCCNARVRLTCCQSDNLLSFLYPRRRDIAVDLQRWTLLQVSVWLRLTIVRVNTNHV